MNKWQKCAFASICDLYLRAHWTIKRKLFKKEKKRNANI